MRIVHAEIAAFGYLSGESIDLDQPIVALLGPNEAGKSTLFHFFRSMLYGFYPASRDQYPYVPWSGATAEGAVDIRLNDGRELRITRRLMSQPDGRLIEGDAVETIRNRTVPFIDHIDQRVFDAIYALTLSEMAAIEQSAWSDVQDRLLGGMNVEHIRSAREVIAELEKEASTYWRDDQRSRPRARELSEGIRALVNSRAEAADADRRLRELNESIAQKEQELRDLKNRQVEFTAERRKMQRIWPVKRRLEQIRSREEIAGDVSELQGLPPDVGYWLGEREKAIEQAENGIRRREEELESLNAEIDAVSDADRLLLDHEAELDELLSERGPHRDRLNRRQERANDVRTEREKLDQEASRFLNAWDDQVAARVRDLPYAELSQRIDNLQKAFNALRDLETRHEAEVSARPAPTRVAPRLIAAAIACVVALVLWFAGIASLAVVAGLAAAVAGTLAYQSYFESRRVSVDTTYEARRATAVADRDARRSELAELLEDIPLPPSRMEAADASLTADLNALRRLLTQLDAVERALTDLDEAVAADVQRARALAATAGVDGEGDFASITQEIQKALAAARERRDAAGNAERRAAELERDLTEAKSALEELRTEHQAIEQRVRQVGEGDVHLGIETIKEKLEASRSARTLIDSLEKDFPDWRTLEAESKSMPELEWSHEIEARLDQDLEDLSQQIETLTGEISAADADRRHLSGQVTVSEIDSEVAWMESELEDAQRRRDRLQLLANLVRQADLRYRERHQPDVLRRAGRYMAEFTGGRYERLNTDESDGSLLVLPPGQLTPTEIDRVRLSQGTRDQIYLALRLAIADHLDEGRVRAPLFLDETFVNWDADRRQKGLEALATMSNHRQIFVFTCHPWFAEEIEAHAGGTVARLQNSTVAQTLRG